MISLKKWCIIKHRSYSFLQNLVALTLKCLLKVYPNKTDIHNKVIFKATFFTKS